MNKNKWILRTTIATMMTTMVAAGVGGVGAAHATTPAGLVSVNLSQALRPTTANTPCTSHGPFGTGLQMRRVPISATGTRDCYLVQGNEGGGVSALQTAIRFCEGYSIGPYGVDGKFGADTKAAVKSIQRAKRLTIDGEYGNRTHNAIRFSNRIGGADYCNRDSAI